MKVSSQVILNLSSLAEITEEEWSDDVYCCLVKEGRSEIQS